MESSFLSLTDNFFSISFRDHAIQIGDIKYKGLTFIVRLLTYEEFIKVSNLEAVADPPMILFLEEEIFKTCVYKVIGVNQEEIVLDDMESGVISTIVSVVLSRTREYFDNLEKSMQIELSRSSVYEQMELVVANAYNIPYAEVKKMPINDLVKKMALYNETFPHAAFTIGGPEKAE